MADWEERGDESSNGPNNGAIIDDNASLESLSMMKLMKEKRREEEMGGQKQRW